jgi:sulfur relay (sulfurtransferase) DsrC/TusE family protein
MSETQIVLGALGFAVVVFGVVAASLREVRKEIKDIHARISDERKEILAQCEAMKAETIGRVKEWRRWTDERIERVEIHLKDNMQANHVQVMAHLEKISEDLKIIPDIRARVRVLERQANGITAQINASSAQS